MSDSDQSVLHQQRLHRHPGALLALIVILLAGCTGPGTRFSPAVTPPTTVDRSAAPSPGSADTRPQPSTSPESMAAEAEIWPRLRGGFRLGDDADHPRVAEEIRRLQRSPKAFRALMARAEPYLYHVLNKIETAEMPTELALLPAVESGFRPDAYSRDGAAGLWQFMPATGQMLGLERDWWFDKRRAVRASTTAAVEYLERLNRRFDGDWLLALAAYNAGAGTVSRAIRIAQQRGEEADFWSLDLPGETDRYIPRLLALAAVVADPDAYGLDLPEILDNPYFAPTGTDGQIDLNVAATLAGIPIEELLALNAGHRRWSSPPDGPHELLLPVERVEGFKLALAALPEDQRLRWRHHRVRRGDSLNRIAREYGVTVEAIRQSNGLSDTRIRAGEELIIPASDAILVAGDDADRRARQRLHYRVRKGDSLYTIARRFQVSVDQLKRWNRVGRYIRPGERLTLFIDPDA